MSSRLLALAACAAALVSGTASARAAAPGTPLSLRECLALALSHNPTLQAAHAVVRGSEAGVSGAWGGILPHLSPLTYGYSQSYYSKSDTATKIFFGNAVLTGRPVGYTAQGDHSMNLALSTDVFSFARWSELTRSRKELEASETSAIDTRESVAFATVQSYYDLVGAEKRRDVAIEAAGNARERMIRAKAFYNVGSSSRGDVSKAVRDHAQSQVDSIAAENVVAVSRARLAATLGIDPAAPLEVVSDLDDSTQPAPVVGNEDAGIVVGRRADVVASQARVAAAEAGHSVAKASILPSLSLSVNDSWSANHSLVPGSIDKNFTLTYFAQLSVPLFDVVGNRARIAQAAAAAEQAHFQLQERRQAATQDLVSARTSTRQVAAQVSAARTAVSAAEDDYDFSRERFRVGAGTSLELEDAQLGLKRARLSLIDALVQAKVADAALARAEGRSLVDGLGSAR